MAPKRQHKRERPRLDEDQILAWADAYYEAHGKWPTRLSGLIPGAHREYWAEILREASLEPWRWNQDLTEPTETWASVDQAMRHGHRGLLPGSSLAILLAARRGRRNLHELPPLTVEEILAWADAHLARTGRWPTAKYGAIPEAPGETWASVNLALIQGSRGLPGASSLANLLAKHRNKRNHLALPAFTEDQILAWADAHRARTGKWPQVKSGAISEAPGETWMAVGMALSVGSRGMEGGSSLAKLLAAQRGVHNRYEPPALAEDEILVWADAHLARTGRWPTAKSGPIPESPGKTWLSVHNALRNGSRGLPGGSSLASFLVEKRHKRNLKALPPYTEEQVLAWADAFRETTGKWPTVWSGPIADTDGETWAAVNVALKLGIRGVPGGTTLARLLATHRGLRNVAQLPHFTVAQILEWADAYFRHNGRWPTGKSGPISEAPEESWLKVEKALTVGRRGLPGGSSVAQLLAEHRGTRNKKGLPALSETEILSWARAHHERTGKWPSVASGPIPESVGETWSGVDSALSGGIRGLAGGSSLARLLAEHAEHRNSAALPRLTQTQILAWADAYHERTGRWPNQRSGSIVEAPGETWGAVETALSKGIRGLTGGSSLARLLAEHRGKRNPMAVPHLTEAQILAWADAYHERTGEWPHANSGSIPEAPGECWSAVHGALRLGARGLPGGTSLARLLAAHRNVRNLAALPPYTEEQILAWADAHHARTGRWPNCSAGPIEEASGETWSAVGAAIRVGIRGMPGGSTLHRLLQKHGRKTN